MDERDKKNRDTNRMFVSLILERSPTLKNLVYEESEKSYDGKVDEFKTHPKGEMMMVNINLPKVGWV
jgi:hypothetical protein